MNNKSSIFNIALSVAVIVLFVLHFSGEEKVEDQNSDEQVSHVEEKDSVEVPVMSSNLDSLGLDSVQLAGTSKIGYFKLEEVITKCSFLKRKEEYFLNKEKRLIASKQNKEQELESWYMTTERRMKELEHKGLLNQAVMANAQQEFMKKQQDLQQELLIEEKALVKDKEEYALERDNIIYSAVQDLNKHVQLDYVLVDNHMARMVVPMNEKNNITEDLIKIINKRRP